MAKEGEEILRERVVFEMKDGVTLSAAVWRPRSGSPVPCILEYIPYGSGVWSIERDEKRLAYFASHGYACCRADMRGSGESGGVYYDEYLLQEQDDAIEIIALLSSLSWCDGQVAMYGKSWGGFNGLQVAARGKEVKGLKCVITLFSTVDRYADDIHYYGALFNANAHVPWGAVMLAYNARPSQISFSGDWKEGIADGYSDITFKMARLGIKSPIKYLLGPWGHQWPDAAEPGPNIGYLQECLRYLDKTLKGEKKEREEEESQEERERESEERDFSFYLADGQKFEPSPNFKQVPGEWITLQHQKDGIENYTFSFNCQTREASFKKEKEKEKEKGEKERNYNTIPYNLKSGLTAGDWLHWGDSSLSSSPPCQLSSLSPSLTLSSLPFCLDFPVNIVGLPVFSCRVRCDKPVGQLCVRLLHYSPSGEKVALIGRGVWNLCLWQGREKRKVKEKKEESEKEEEREREECEWSDPCFVPEKEEVEVRFEMNSVCYRIPPGHSIGLAIFSSAFPLVWPAPNEVKLEVSDVELVLPCLTEEKRISCSAPNFLCPEKNPPFCLSADEFIKIIEPAKKASRQLQVHGKHHLLELVLDEGIFEAKKTGMRYGEKSKDTWSFQENNPLSCLSRSEYEIVMMGERGEKGEGEREGEREREEVKILAMIEMKSDEENFYVVSQLVCLLNNSVFWEKKENRAVKRVFM